MNREALATHKKDLEELLPDMALHLPPTHAQKLRDLVDGLGDALENPETVQPVEPAAEDFDAAIDVIKIVDALHAELERRAEADVVQAATLESISASLDSIANSLMRLSPGPQV